MRPTIAAGYVAIGRLSVSITISLARLATMGRAFAPRHHPTTPGDNLTAFFTDSTLAWISWVMTRTSTGAKASLASRQYQFQLSAGQFQRSERLLGLLCIKEDQCLMGLGGQRRDGVLGELGTLFRIGFPGGLVIYLWLRRLGCGRGAAAPGLEPAADWARAGPLSPTTTARASAEKVYWGCLIFMILGSLN